MKRKTEAKYFREIQQADISYSERDKLLTHVNFVFYYESHCSEGVIPDRAWLDNELKKKGVKI